MSDATDSAQKKPAPEVKEPPEQKHGWWDWVRANSGRINQLGLMTGTAVILGSVWRNKKISQDIFAEQTKLLREEFKKNGLAEGPELEKAVGDKVAELLKNKDALLNTTVMKKPGLHRWRMVYLPTAILGLAIGGFIKDKETPQDREQYKSMSMPAYLLTRLKQAFDPLHHSRQTAGVVGALSGVFAIISALTQPGGALISEAFVGATLISGFTGLTFINDPAKAKQALNVFWATRLPFVISGTYETLVPPPKFANPLIGQVITNPAHLAAAEAAKTAGVKVPRWGLGIGKYALAGHRTLFGEKAAAAFLKSKVMLPLGYKRMDVSYPIGQWFNMGMATFGFLMAGSDEKAKAAAAAEPKAEPKPEAAPMADSTPTKPATRVSEAHVEPRMAAAMRLA